MRGLSRAVSDNIGGIENFMMKKVLGEEELFVPSKVQKSVQEGKVTDQQIASLRSHMQDMGYTSKKLNKLLKIKLEEETIVSCIMVWAEQ